MNKIKQLLYDMRHQRMMTWVSIIGTALAIFLLMIFIMSENIMKVEMAPESHRTRIMYGKNFHTKELKGNGDNSTSGINHELAARLYDNLDGVEAISYVRAWHTTVDANEKGEESISCSGFSVDENFWKIYDFRFIYGRPFDKAERQSEVKSVILTRSTARRIFGEENVTGREIEVNMIPYSVIGVVEDVSPLLDKTYAQIYFVFNPDGQEEIDPWFGQTNVRLLLREGTDPADVKRQVEERYRRLAPEGEKENVKLIYHNQPYDIEDAAVGFDGSNTTPETATHRTLQWVIYAILLLIPAINLSSMTRGRLRHRTAEIGVRRAFGARRISIVGQLFGENLIITLAGGVIGLVLSIVFILCWSTLLFTYVPATYGDVALEVLDTTPDLAMVFRWDTFVFALAACLILNTLSAIIPAWRASRVVPAVALSSSK